MSRTLLRQGTQGISSVPQFTNLRKYAKEILLIYFAIWKLSLNPTKMIITSKIKYNKTSEMLKSQDQFRIMTNFAS